MKKLKTKLAKRFTSPRKSPNFNTKNVLIYVVGFALVGALLILISHAATPTTSFEPETKTVVSPVIIGNDSNASGDKYIQFKKQQQTAGRQRIIAWHSIVSINNLLGNQAGGITLATLRDNNISGNVISIDTSDGPIPDWEIGEFRSTRAYGTLNVGYRMASTGARLPMTSSEIARSVNQWQNLANAAKAAGANGLAMDGEAYGYPGNGDDPASNPWNLTTAAVMRSYGQQVGAITRTVGDGTFYAYTSSVASWPGSLFDAYAVNAGNCGGQSSCYLNSKFPDFLKGVMEGGAKVIYTDATFHSSSADGDVAAKTRDTVRRTAAEFPGIQTGIMFWPDNREGSHAGGKWFSPGQVENIVDAGTANSTGPIIMYQQQLASNTITSLWFPWLAAVKAGSQ